MPPTPASFARILLSQSQSSLGATSTKANGSGWSSTYECFVCGSPVDSFADIISLIARLHCSFSLHNKIHNGFLLRLQIFHVLDPLYMTKGLFNVDSDHEVIHFPPPHLSSFSNVRNFVLSTFNKFGVPTTDTDPLVQIIFSFALHHQHTSTTKVVPLYISFTITTVLRNQDEAIDWMHGGTAYSQIVKTLRPTYEAVSKLKRETFDGSSLRSGDNSCMVCLEGFRDGRKVSRLPCKHEYHSVCISQWLKFNHQCPICRFPMPWVQTLLPEISTSNLDNIPIESVHDDDRSALEKITKLEGWWSFVRVHGFHGGYVGE